jgi:hypothetical protein
MTLQKIMELLELNPLTSNVDLSGIEPNGVYCSDLLSCVMSGAKNRNIWVTLQSHNNIVAVAALLDLAAVIITENAKPEAESIKKAEDEGIVLFSTSKTNFEVCGRLWDMGYRG